jgi:glycosyltransferase involved in cell wall biosynthesis
MDSVWITWHKSVRSRNLSKEFQVKLLEIEISNNILLRHVGSSIWTILVLIKYKPRTIYLQYSFMLLIIISFYKLIKNHNVYIICDCHTKALRRNAPGLLKYIFMPIKRFSFKYVNIILISNNSLKKDVKNIIVLEDKYIYILPDKIPTIRYNKNLKKEEKYCVYINSYAVDEPFHEIIIMAKIIKNDIKIYITGKIPKHLKKYILHHKDQNIIFTNYLEDSEYNDLIGNASCLLILTKEEDCLQCGAYEALSVNVPMVLTKTNALKNYFGDSATYTNNDPESIAEGIKISINKSSSIKLKMNDVKNAKIFEFWNIVKYLNIYIEQDKVRKIA